jgi:hypothetical protein
MPAHQRLVNLIFSIGIGLVILTTLARINYSTMGSNAGGLPNLEFTRFSGAEAGALLYFVFGLALLSLSRLMSLQRIESLRSRFLRKFDQAVGIVQPCSSSCWQ